MFGFLGIICPAASEAVLNIQVPQAAVPIDFNTGWPYNKNIHIVEFIDSFLAKHFSIFLLYLKKNVAAA